MGAHQNNGDTQLYNLLNRLSREVPDSMERHLLISYSLVDSLERFRSNSGSSEERIFQEVKSTYEGLTEVIKQSEKGKSYHHLCGLKTGVDPLLKLFLENPELNKSDSKLFGLIITNLRSQRKNYVDVLRRNGDKLQGAISSKGILIGRANILKEDYESIEYSFVSRR